MIVWVRFPYPAFARGRGCTVRQDEIVGLLGERNHQGLIVRERSPVAEWPEVTALKVVPDFGEWTSVQMSARRLKPRPSV